MESSKEDMFKTISFLKNEYLTLRAGRANPHILDKVTVDYYGTMTPINQMANISVPEARVLLINVWDQSQLKNVAKAITVADLGVNPMDDGKVIRLIFPSLTEERRKDIVKAVKTLAENAKISIRSTRRDCLDLFKQMKKDGELTEDELAGIEKEVQKIVDSFNEQIESLCESKEKEIMEI
ncbi:MAG: ribosome recycling factor [Clostridia bacterium]|nr:ribosome recycling factor [Clostridia bacterium]